MLKEFGSIEKRKTAVLPSQGQDSAPKAIDDNKDSGSPKVEQVK